MCSRLVTTLAACSVALIVVVAGACGDGRPDEGAGADDAPVVTTMLDGRDMVRPTAWMTEGSGSAEPGDGSAPVSPPGSEPERPDGESLMSGASVVTGARSLIDGGFGPLLDRRVGLIANRASTVDGRPLIDILHDDPRVELVALFAPEHGVTAEAGAGEEVADGVDGPTGLTVHSLYGSDRAPSVAALTGLDVLVFDLQDAGTRFYTYTATMGLAMQAAARAGIPFVVLDRPNPLGGDRPDGPLRAADQSSFVGLYPIPSVHGLTAGELAWAIEGERWLDGLDRLDLQVVEMQGWHRRDRWPDTGLSWHPPSPGLPTGEAALLYPATVLLEATTVSYGRGTDRPFTQLGAPGLDGDELARRLQGAGLAGVDVEAVRFTPDGEATGSAGEATVTHAGVEVTGVGLRVTDTASVRPMEVAVHLLHHLIELAGPEIIDRTDFFDRLAGSADLRLHLVDGRPPAEIVAAWDADLGAWADIHRRYRLYDS